MMWGKLLIAQPAGEGMAFRAMSTQERCQYIQAHHCMQMDSTAFVASYEPLLHIAEEMNDSRAAWMLRHARYLQRGPLRLTQEAIITLLSTQQAVAERNGMEVEQVVASHYLAFERYYAKQIPTEALFITLLREFETMETLGFEHFRDYEVAALLYHSGKFLYQLEDEERALACLLKAEEFIEPTAQGIHTCFLIWNHIQTIYQQRKDYPRGIAYAEKILRLARDFPTDDARLRKRCQQWEGLSSIDIAAMLAGQGNFAESETFASQGYEQLTASSGQLTLEDLNAEYDALQVLIATQLELGKRDHAAHLLGRMDQVYALVKEDENNYFNHIAYFECHARYSEITGDAAAALTYFQQARCLRDSLARRNDARRLEQVRLRVETEKYMGELARLESERKLQRWQRNAALATLALVVVIAYAGFQRMRLQRRKKEAELVRAEADLRILTQHFQEKSQLVEHLREEMAQLQATGLRSQYLEELTSSTILTDADWLRFRTLFEKVHPAFIAEQKTLYPGITQAELRYLLLEKLQLSTREMANMLGVADGTVRQTRSRLRKKSSN